VPMQPEARLYLERAHLALLQSRDNLGLDYYDVAIARAYYAMFYAATALLRARGISRSKHSGVYSAFGEHLVKPGHIEPEYSRMLVNAFNLRLDSDYEVSPILNRELAEDVLSDAEHFVRRAASYLEEHDV
jgi:uncharacterized protein